MAEAQQTQLLGEPKEVDLMLIEKELLSLWKNASETNGDVSPIVRACSLNFIIITENERELGELSDVAGEVTLEHPARIFLISADRGSGTSKLDVWISARCSLPVPGGKQVCCEQIHIEAKGSEANKIPSIVTSLLVSDVPSVLLWKLRVDPNDGMLNSLSRVVDRILIDSSEDTSSGSNLLAWQEFVRACDSHSTFGDLGWTHLTAWRSLVANAFNPPDMRREITAIDTVTIEYSSTTSPKHSGVGQGLLFIGWLVHKLRWTVLKSVQRTDDGRYEAKLRLEEQAINFRLLPVEPRSNFPGGIESITFHTRSGLTLKFATTEHRSCGLSVHGRDGESTQEFFSSLSDSSEATLIAQELEASQRDIGYEEALTALSRLFKA